MRSASVASDARVAMGRDGDVARERGRSERMWHFAVGAPRMRERDEMRDDNVRSDES